MSEISRVSEHNIRAHRQQELNQLDKRHNALRLEELRIKEQLKNNEEKRIEMNRRMNRSGLNVDSMV